MPLFVVTIKGSFSGCMKINIWLLLTILLAWLAFESCRLPRCPLASCHIRMKHRHPSMDGEGGFNPDANIDPRSGESLSASGGGKVYRGVPFYERNKNPKIAQGYKEGYKYRHKKQKPLTAAQLKKIEEKRNREQAKIDRKTNKNKTPDEVTEGEPVGDAPTGAVQEGTPEGETRAERRQRKKESRKKAKEEKETQPEAKPAEEAPRRQPPPKPAEDEKKDGF
jgi:hypothetical protein